MYRFLLRPKWIAFHLLVVAAIVTMLLLASWQWTRYNDRQEFVDLVETRQAAEPQPLAPLLETESPAAIRVLRVTATGEYLGDDELIQINRTQDGVNGVDAVTPFQIDGGPIVIVNRGFVADGADPPPPPEGPLTVGGTARTSQVRRTGELTDNQSGRDDEIRRIDLPLIEQRLGYEVAPVYLELIASDPPSPEPPVPVPAPDVSGGPPHLSYAVQWCIFSIAVAAGWLLVVRRAARVRPSA